MKLEKIDFDVLKEMAKTLNTLTYQKDGAEVPYIKKIKVVAVSKEGLAKAFDAAVQGIDADVINTLPESMIDFYNANFVEEGEGAEAATETAAAAAPAGAAAPAPEKEKKEKAKKEAKPPKEKKEKKEIPLSCFGHQVGSQAAALDDLLNTGNAFTLEELSTKSGRSVLGVKSHIKHLQEARSLTIGEKDGKFQLVKK
jgi:hypothetical protein